MRNWKKWLKAAAIRAVKTVARAEKGPPCGEPRGALFAYLRGMTS